MTTIKLESSTNKNLDLKNALLFNEFIGSDEFGYQGEDDGNIFDDKIMSYMSRSYNKNNSCYSENIETFILDKMNDEFEVDSAFSTELKSTSTSSYNDSIVLDDKTLIADNSNIQQLSFCIILDFINGQFQQCCDITLNQHSLKQLIGTWEIDKKVFEKAKSNKQLHSLEALQIFGNWILQTVTTENEEKKTKTILKIGHVELSTNSDEYFKFSSETLEKIGKQLG
ncbi:15502_t:CDS:2, partial [Cetraspora pellucida]